MARERRLGGVWCSLTGDDRIADGGGGGMVSNHPSRAVHTRALPIELPCQVRNKTH